MAHFSINLPKRLTLSLRIERKRGRPEKSIFPSVDEVLRAKESKRVSFFFRHVFEHKKITRLVGANLIFLIIVSSFFTPNVKGNMETEDFLLTSPTVLTTEVSTQFPTKVTKITQGFKFYHPGIDMDGVTGDSVYPVTAGKVEKVEFSRFGYGKSIVISHGSNLVSLYAHLSKIEVAEGQIVSKETKLGEIGATGRAFGDHLHLEIHEDGKAINPLIILNN